MLKQYLSPLSLRVIYIFHFHHPFEKLTIDITCLVFSPFSHRACVCSPFNPRKRLPGLLMYLLSPSFEERSEATSKERSRCTPSNYTVECMRLWQLLAADAQRQGFSIFYPLFSYLCTLSPLCHHLWGLIFITVVFSLCYR